MFAVVGGLAGELHVVTPQELQKQINDTDRNIAATKDNIRPEDGAGHDTGTLDKQLDDLEDEAQTLGGAARFVPGVKSSRPGEGGKVMGFHTGWATLDHDIDKANENPDLFLYRL